MLPWLLTLPVWFFYFIALLHCYFKIVQISISLFLGSCSSKETAMIIHHIIAVQGQIVSGRIANWKIHMFFISVSAYLLEPGVILYFCISSVQNHSHLHICVEISTRTKLGIINHILNVIQHKKEYSQVSIIGKESVVKAANN